VAFRHLRRISLTELFADSLELLDTMRVLGLHLVEALLFCGRESSLYLKIKGIYRMPGSKFYWYRWTQGGKRRAVSLKTDDLSGAVKAVRRIQAGEWIARWERAEAPETAATSLVEDSMAQQRAKKPMRTRTAKTIKYILLKFLKDNRIESAQKIDCRTVEQ
jgi:hypothetical protein